MKKNHTPRVLSMMLVLILAAISLTACGDKDDAAAALSPDKGEERTSDEGDPKPSKTKDDDTEDAAEADKLSPEEQYPEEEIDKEWMEVLEANGTFYDAFYNLRKIMKEEEPNHPDNVKMPNGIIKENNDYYIPDLQSPETESVDASEIIGRWIPVYSLYQDIKTDFTWAREAEVDFHLDLNDDGTSSCNIIGGEQTGTWNDKTIPINGKDCTYGMEDDYLVLTMNIAPGLDMYYAFERDVKNNDFVRAHENDESGYLGHRLPGAKLYRAKSPDLDPKTHFVVLVETDEEYHNGYGYMREGVTDTALYYQSDRGIIKPINENTTDRSRNNVRWKFEMENDDRLLRVYHGYGSESEESYEYELCADEEAPRCHLDVGPVPNRDEIEVPEGTHEKAGFYRVDKIYAYTSMATDPLMENPVQAGVDDNVYGTDTRKYDADFWYVLKEDGTGYMRAWNRYFEVTWCDDVQYYYDISGKHQLGTIVGEIDYDDTFMRMFRDELNEVPDYPDELTFEGAKKLKEEIEKKREERAKNKDKE